MSAYRVEYATTVYVSVEIEADDEDQADEVAHTIVEDYLNTLGTQTGDDRIKWVEASIDGIGAKDVREVSA